MKLSKKDVGLTRELLELGIQFAKAMKNDSLAQKGQNLLDRFNISSSTPPDEGQSDVTFKEAEHVAGFVSDTHSQFDGKEVSNLTVRKGPIVPDIDKIGEVFGE